MVPSAFTADEIKALIIAGKVSSKKPRFNSFMARTMTYHQS